MSSHREAITPLELAESVRECMWTLSHVFEHAEDGDVADEVALLLADLRDVKQAASECFDRVESHLTNCRPTYVDTKTGEIKPVKEMVVVGLGPIEFKTSTSRKEWKNEELWSDVVRYARNNDGDPVALLSECARPSWRVTPLRAIGINPADYCIETPGEVKPVLPPRDIEDRGRSVETGDAA